MKKQGKKVRTVGNKRTVVMVLGGGTNSGDRRRGKKDLGSRFCGVRKRFSAGEFGERGELVTPPARKEERFRSVALSLRRKKKTVRLERVMGGKSGGKKGRCHLWGEKGRGGHK